jgi:hypothetical protein
MYIVTDPYPPTTPRHQLKYVQLSQSESYQFPLPRRKEKWGEEVPGPEPREPGKAQKKFARESGIGRGGKKKTPPWAINPLELLYRAGLGIPRNY